MQLLEKYQERNFVMKYGSNLAQHMFVLIYTLHLCNKEHCC
jgi:hypothetical protein